MKRIKVLLLILCMMFLMFGCSGQEEYEGTREKPVSKENYETSEKEREDRPKVPETQKENIPEATPTPKLLYTVKDTSGELTLEVKPGFAVTVTRREKYVAAKEGAKVMLPDLAAWSDGKISVKTISTTSDGTKQQDYTMNEKITIELLDEYFNLLEEYSMGKGERKSYRDLQADATWQVFSYTGDEEITRNAVEDSTLGVCDLYFYTNLKKNILYFKFPADICFIDTGDRIGGKKTEPEEDKVYENKTQVSYEVTQTGLDSFKITGWNQVAGDYIKISLHPELYEEGDSFSLKDFSAQADAGTGKLMEFIVDSDEIGAETGQFFYKNRLSPCKDYIEMFESLQVNVLEKTEELCVLQYAVKLHGRQGDDFTLDGLFAAKTGSGSTGEDSAGEASGTSEDNTSVYTGSDKCTHCSGTGKTREDCAWCHRTGKKNCPDCNGTGKERCTGCGGDGKNWDSLNGTYSKCYKCFGNGKMTCDKCRGTGDVNCNSCNGKGYNQKTCTFCFGTGKQ